MKVGVVDIGTNTMRLLITDGVHEDGRWVEVTGLGVGVDATGRLSDPAMLRTLEVFAEFGRLMTATGVEQRCAIATSASRDADNREVFFDAAEPHLGVRPTLIAGEREARLAYNGATATLEMPGPIVVIDIGGGSTELVTETHAFSVDIGSVRLTDRILGQRPAAEDEMERARTELSGLLIEASAIEAATVLGVAGTWTSLAAICKDLAVYDRDLVHGTILSALAVHDLVVRLSELSVEDTANLPSLDPLRAPVILGGAVIAESVMTALNVDEVMISESDSLDGVAMELLALR